MTERLKNLQIALNNVTKRINEQDDTIRKYTTKKCKPAEKFTANPLSNYEIVENYYRKIASGYEERQAARERLTIKSANLRKDAS